MHLSWRQVFHHVRRCKQLGSTEAVEWRMMNSLSLLLKGSLFSIQTMFCLNTDTLQQISSFTHDESLSDGLLTCRSSTHLRELHATELSLGGETMNCYYKVRAHLAFALRCQANKYSLMCFTSASSLASTRLQEVCLFEDCEALQEGAMQRSRRGPYLRRAVKAFESCRFTKLRV